MSCGPVRSPLRVLIGISGGIAAYKIPGLVRLLRKAGCETKVVLSEAARGLVGAEALRTVSGSPVYSDQTPSSYDMDHIRLAEWASLMLICPATANTLAKIAHGIADNLLTTLALCFEGPLLVAPAMNSAMWTKQVTQANIGRLKERGIDVLAVQEGELACGSSGPGRMLGIECIVEQVLGASQPRALDGVSVLIASGPTCEALDPVRVLTNRSSGKMGHALASQAIRMGARVTVVTGPGTMRPPAGARVIDVTSASEMAEALNKEFDTTQACIMAAAVSDFRPRDVSQSKLSRRTSETVTIELVPNPDILAFLGNKKNGQVLVGFALEDTLDEKRAEEKMHEKKCDMMVLNQVATALGTDTSAAVLLSKDSATEKIPLMSKNELAREILTRIANRINNG